MGNSVMLLQNRTFNFSINVGAGYFTKVNFNNHDTFNNGIVGVSTI